MTECNREREKCKPGIPPKYKEIYTEINEISDINVANNLEKSNEESQGIRPIMIKNYIRENNSNSVKILHTYNDRVDACKKLVVVDIDTIIKAKGSYTK
ncbi:hypothetical protein Glove_140g10 [Diversispora epigaea]|uniref:Uncharacterized protein n=1 Tax=Diversispora epigaea TaxID=1348612 RepID=A0A397J3L4_9GLOM|nr:hypothetical protein Glove_140g10 [Diversispora epigaea]